MTVLATLGAGSAHSCVTSPPYWGLRDYGTPPVAWPEVSFAPMSGLPPVTVPAQSCELGQEADPWAFVGHLVLIFREVRRVLRDDGVALVNIGDSYANDGKWGGATSGKHAAGVHGDTGVGRAKRATGLKPKDLVGIPWRLALALQADGWTLRQDIIWHKPNPMPESVTDRCTKAHEYIFLLSKGPRYFWDAAAISEPLAASSVARLSQNVDAQAGSDRVPAKTNGSMKAVGGARSLVHLSFKREGSKRAEPMLGQSVGTHRPDRDEGAAFAIEEFLGRLPGNTAHKGAAAYESGAAEHRTKAGLVDFAQGRAQLRRAMELALDHGLTREHLEALRAVGLSDRRNGLQDGAGKNTPETHRLADEARAALGSYASEFLTGTTRNRRSVWTVATKSFKEAHYAVMSPDLARDLILASTPPGGTVLDPFLGSGTTLREAWRLGRECIGIELHPDNVAMGERLGRNTQPGLGLVGA